MARAGITERQCYALIGQRLAWPLPTVCVNEAACWVLDAMAEAGLAIDDDFASAVVDSGGAEEALAYIRERTAAEPVERPDDPEGRTG